MATLSTIEWTERTWNPVAGCTKISPGCRNCYAERMACRQAGMARKHPDSPGRWTHYLKVINSRGRWNNAIELIPESLNDPLHWKTPQLVFVNSMSDLFHEDVPFDFITKVFDVMNACDRHTFQVLTKRSERLAELSPYLTWGKNIWMGVSVESLEYVSRIEDLRRIGAATRFLSLEPLLGPLPNLNLDRINWAIVGGESGAGARPMEPPWAMNLRDQCIKAGVPFFFKQWGQIRNNPNAQDPTAKQNGGTAKGGRLLEGRTWDDMPDQFQSDLERTRG